MVWVMKPLSSSMNEQDRRDTQQCASVRGQPSCLLVKLRDGSVSLQETVMSFWGASGHEGFKLINCFQPPARPHTHTSTYTHTHTLDQENRTTKQDRPFLQACNWPPLFSPPLSSHHLPPTSPPQGSDEMSGHLQLHHISGPNQWRQEWGEWRMINPNIPQPP